MIPRLIPYLERLGADIAPTAIGSFRGWVATDVELTPQQIDLACEAYRASLIPDLPVEITQAFAESGQSIERFLLAADESNETLTRSDITELIAAATLMKTESIDGTCIELPNVPKRSRASSEHGADYVALRLAPGGDPATWNDGDMLFVGSVKHTIADADDLRRKLVASLGKTGMPRRKLRGEVRVLVDQLSRTGIDARRAFLALLSFPDPNRVTMVAVGVMGPVHHKEFCESLVKLPRHRGRRHLSAIAIADLDRLHTRIA